MAVVLAIMNDLEKGGVHFITMNSIKMFKISMIFVIIILDSEDFP